MPRAGHEMHAKALDPVVGIVERVDLQLAAIARAGVYSADRETAAEQFADRRLETLADLLQGRLIDARQILGEDAGALDLGRILA